MMEINWGWVFAGVGLAWTIILTLWTRHAQSKNAREKDVTDLKGEVNTLGGKLTSLEQRVDSMPTNEAVHNLQLAMTDMKGDIRVVNEQLKPISSTVKRIDDYLLRAKN